MRELTERESIEIIDWWLKKFFDTNLADVKEKYGFTDGSDDDTREFYAKHRVTQDQYDEWKKWAVEFIRTRTGRTRKMIELGWWSIELGCSPSVIQQK